MLRANHPAVTELNDRSREIFRNLVETYVETGEPVGSRTLSRRLKMALSPATIRNVMMDLEESGLLYAPHISAGRLPTELGMRLFVDGLLQVGQLSVDERARIDERCRAAGKSVEQAMGETLSMLSGLSRCAGLVIAPKTHRALKHLEFVHLGPTRVLVVMITEDGVVENRVLEVPPGMPPSALIEATNYLNARVAGLTLEEARERVLVELEEQKSQLDEVASRLVEAGLATWAGDADKGGSLIVRGQSHLLDDVAAVEDLERVRQLFEMLEQGEHIAGLLDLANKADGVQIFIGAENHLFSMTGCTMIVAPYHNSREQIVGAIGVVGPTRLNYARIIPMVDYTARVMGRIIG
jgi:heat-inducible transcriptional repressor